MERIFCFVTSKQRAQWAADRAERTLDHRSHPLSLPFCRFRRRTFDAGRGVGSIKDQATKSRLQHIVECPLCNPAAESAITSSRPLSFDSFLLLLLSGYLVPWQGRGKRGEKRKASGRGGETTGQNREEKYVDFRTSKPKVWLRLLPFLFSRACNYACEDMGIRRFRMIRRMKNINGADCWQWLFDNYKLEWFFLDFV